jgi:hypothetical protein
MKQDDYIMNLPIMAKTVLYDVSLLQWTIRNLLCNLHHTSDTQEGELNYKINTYQWQQDR